MPNDRMSNSPAGSREIYGLSDVSITSEISGAPSERMGLLSTTLAPSPAVRWIIPARIRSPHHNDVVFVGSTYVQLREFHEHGQLSDATAKLDLGVQILAAKVISARAEETKWEEQVLTQQGDNMRFFIRDQLCKDDQPPQIVVLATAAHELLYVYAKNFNHGRHVEFVFAKRALLQDTLLASSRISHMAIDVECKVMAVATHAVCAVLSLKDVDHLKDSIDAWDPKKPQSFQPSHEQRMFQVDGHILRMDFLRPSEYAPHKAILLLLIVNNGQTLLLPYTWDVRESLNHFEPVTGVLQSLPPEDKFPLLLIPSPKPASFAVVTETSIVYYDNVIFGYGITPIRVPLYSQPQQSKGQLWVQWATPVRHYEHRLKTEDILILREDGQIKLLSRLYKSSNGMASTYSPGKLDVGVDTAMCMLQGPRHLGGDILIVGGCMIDGAVFHLRARESHAALQIIPNLSPIHNITMLNSGATAIKDSRARRLYVVSGLPEKSRLSELRFGLEAQIQWTVPIMESETVNQVWSLARVESRKVYILASHLEHTTAIIYDIFSKELESMDLNQFPGLQLDDCTLAAEILASGIAVQITPKIIAVGFDMTLPTILRISECICADINRDDGTFAMACKIGQEYSIKVGLISKGDEQPTLVLSSSPHNCSGRPLCLKLFQVADVQYLAVGYLDGKIDLFSINEDGLELKSSSLPSSTESSAVTSVVILNHVYTPYALMIAGTRDGKLKVFGLTIKASHDQTEIDCRPERTYQVGMTTVNIADERCLNYDGSLGAVIMCGSRLDRISYFRNAYPDYMLSSVWLSKRNELTYNHSTFTSVQRVQSFDEEFPGGFLLCDVNEGMLFAEPIEREQIIPRRLKSEGSSARHVTFSKYLDKFIVASDSAVSSGYSESRLSNTPTLTTLYVVDPHELPDEDKRDVKIYLSDHEKVTALTTFKPTDGKVHLDFIMVALSDGTNSRLGFVSAKRIKSNPDNITFRQCYHKLAKRKVHALCEFGNATLIISVGRELYLVSFDITTRIWHEDARYELPSPGLSISTQGSFIYVATSQHSMFILGWRPKEKKFEQVFTDREARNSRVVVPFGKTRDHVLVASMANDGTSLLGYSVKSDTTNNTTPLFEAELPTSIDHITPIPTSWSSSQFAFQGVSSSGSIHAFQTLSLTEYRLLRFVEELAQPDPLKPAKKQIAILTGKFAKAYIKKAEGEGIPHFDPKSWHVKGDVIKRLVDRGPDHFASLLLSGRGSKIKSEHHDDNDDDTMELDEKSSSNNNSNNSKALMKLERLAKPLLGDVEIENLPGAVIAWCRKMLRATIF